MRPSEFFPLDTSRPIELGHPLTLCATRECGAALPGTRFRYCLDCRRKRAEKDKRAWHRRKSGHPVGRRRTDIDWAAADLTRPTSVLTRELGVHSATISYHRRRLGVTVTVDARRKAKEPSSYLTRQQLLATAAREVLALVHAGAGYAAALKQVAADRGVPANTLRVRLWRQGFRASKAVPRAA